MIGLSTGGPSALEQLLPKLPKDFPVPVLIVQHMPKLFTGALAERLDKCCALRVEQAYDNATIRPGTVWLAPGDAHMEIAPRRAMAGDEGRGAGLQQQSPAAPAGAAESLQAVGRLSFLLSCADVWRGNAGSGDDGNGRGRPEWSARGA